jgi:hypothetical protein
VFGKVLSGMDTVYKIEAEGRQNGVPKHQIVVLHSAFVTALFVVDQLSISLQTHQYQCR